MEKAHQAVFYAFAPTTDHIIEGHKVEHISMLMQNLNYLQENYYNVYTENYLNQKLKSKLISHFGSKMHFGSLIIVENSFILPVGQAVEARQMRELCKRSP